MSELHAITDAEAQVWPRRCRVCGEQIGAADWLVHSAGHLHAGLLDLASTTRAANHALIGLGDAMARYQATRVDEPQ